MYQKRAKSWKEILDDIIIVFLAIFVGVIVAYGIYLVKEVISDFADTRHKAQLLCIENGYPDLIGTKDGYYCHKLENGNDVIVSVESLRDDRLK